MHLAVERGANCDCCEIWRHLSNNAGHKHKTGKEKKIDINKQSTNNSSHAIKRAIWEIRILFLFSLTIKSDTNGKLIIIICAAH